MNYQDILKSIPDFVKEVPDIAEKYLELAKHLPLKVNREDMLEWAGVPRRRGVLLPSIVAFGSGVFVGATAALILAPTSGAELRRELLERLRKGSAAKADESASADDASAGAADDDPSVEAADEPVPAEAGAPYGVA